MTIGDRIKTIRGNLRQDAFAEKIGVHINTVGRWERGQSAPDYEQLIKLAEQYPDINLEWLLTGEGEKGGKTGAFKQLANKDDCVELLVNVIQAAIEITGAVESDRAREYAQAAIDIQSFIAELREDLPSVEEIKGMFAVVVTLQRIIYSGHELKEGALESLITHVVKGKKT